MQFGTSTLAICRIVHESKVLPIIDAVGVRMKNRKVGINCRIAEPQCAFVAERNLIF